MGSRDVPELRPIIHIFPFLQSNLTEQKRLNAKNHQRTASVCWLSYEGWLVCRWQFGVRNTWPSGCPVASTQILTDRTVWRASCAQARRCSNASAQVLTCSTFPTHCTCCCYKVCNFRWWVPVRCVASTQLPVAVETPTFNRTIR